MEKVIIGDCTLYCGDTRDILPELGECADLVASDIPYPLTSGGQKGSMGGCFSKENYNNNGSIVECDITIPEIMPLLFNCLRGNAHAYAFSNYRNLENVLREARNAGFRLHKIPTWDKRTATPSSSYMPNVEFIGLFFKGAEKYINDCGSKAGVHVPQENYGGHPTTKPVALMEYYIRNSSQVGETVIDPFMGVGSTGVACKNSDRKFIGVEINKKWFDLACKRIEETKVSNRLI